MIVAYWFDKFRHEIVHKYLRSNWRQPDLVNMPKTFFFSNFDILRDDFYW
jgi:hypothetical protein